MAAYSKLRGCCIAATALLAGFQVHAQTSTASQSGLRPEVATSLAKFGLTIVVGSADLIANSGKSSVSAQEASTLGNDLTSLTDNYRSTVREATFAASLIQANGEVIITASQVLASATGVGVAPAAAIAAVARYGNDQLAGHLAAEGRNRALGMLTSGLQSMSTADRATFDQRIQENKFEEAAQLFDARTKKLSTMEGLLKDDPPAANAARSFVIATLQHGTSTAIIKAGKAYSTATNVEKNLADHVRTTNAFAKTLNSKVDELNQKSEELKTSVDGLSKDLNALREESSATAYQVGIVQDILFDQQPASVKLALLNAGAKPGLSKDQRDTITAYLKVEVRKQEILATATKVVSVANDINTIMSNFNIQDRRLSEAVQFGSVATTALTQAFSSNYLGAIATVSGLFGGAKKDPMMAQFQRVFEEFKQVNEKLDSIIELQKNTLLAIEKLSNQIEVVERKLHERLDLVDYELKVISAATLVALWSEYRPCMDLWDSRRDTAFDFEEEKLRFRTLDGLNNFVTVRWGDAFPCAARLRHAFSHLRNSAQFGNPLRLEFAISAVPGTPPPDATRTFVKNDLQNYMDHVHKPAADLLFTSWETRKISRPYWGHVSGAFALLSTPAASSTELMARVRKLDSGPAATPLRACTDHSLLGDRTKTLLCADARDFDPQKHGANDQQASERTQLFLRQALVRDQVAHLVNWSGLVASAANFAPGGSSSYPPVSLNDLAQHTMGATSTYGKEILDGAMMLVDISIAQQSLVYGDLTAYFVFEQLWDAKERKFKPATTESEKLAHQLLSNANNPWLQRNVLMLILHATERGCPDATCTASELKYEISVAPFYATLPPDNKLAALTPEARQSARELFLAMFDISRDAVFEEVDVSPSGSAIPRRVAMKLGGYSLQMPTVADWTARRLDYPPGMLARIQERYALGERWAEYVVLNRLPIDQKVRLVQAVSHGFIDKNK